MIILITKKTDLAHEINKIYWVYFLFQSFL